MLVQGSHQAQPYGLGRMMEAFHEFQGTRLSYIIKEHVSIFQRRRWVESKVSSNLRKKGERITTVGC